MEAFKIDLKAWLENEAHSQDPIIAPIIDLSIQKAQLSFFGSSPAVYKDGYTEQEFCEAMRLANAAKEVLIKWRGDIPPKYFTVVNLYNENDEQGTLQELLNEIGELSLKRGKKEKDEKLNKTHTKKKKKFTKEEEGRKKEEKGGRD